MQCYIVDTFSDRIFGGNPAAVCVLHDKWLPDRLMQNIAKEHNLSETAFCLCQNGAYQLRWFTPTHEIDLCGHATLASGFVVLNFIDNAQSQVAFKTQSGILYVQRVQNHRDSELYALDLPSFALSQKLEPTSARGGVLYARNLGERVSLSGNAVLFSRNEIFEQNLQSWL